MKGKLKSYYHRWVIRPYVRVRRIGQGILHGVRQMGAWLVAVKSALTKFLERFLVRPVRATWAGLQQLWHWFIVAKNAITRFVDHGLVRPIHRLWQWCHRAWVGRHRPLTWLRTRWTELTTFGKRVAQLLSHIVNWTIVYPARSTWRAGKWLWGAKNQLWHWLQGSWSWSCQTCSTIANIFRHSFRQIIGWSAVIVGVMLVPFPLPFGIPLILIGFLIIGPGDPRVRWLRVNTRRALRMLERRRIPFISPLATKALSLGKKPGSSAASPVESPEATIPWQGEITQRTSGQHRSTNKVGEQPALRPGDELES